MLLFLNVGIAEKLKFSNNNQQVDITGNAQIDLLTGDVTVETVGTHIITPQPPVILGFYPNDYDVALGDNITANWTVVNADSCTASVTSGLVQGSGWTGSKSAVSGNRSQTGLTIAQLPSTLSLSCQNSLPSEVVKTFQITQQTGGSTTNPEINYFRVNGLNNSATVNLPGTATVSWGSTDTTSCIATNTGSVVGWTGALATTGSKQITVSANTQLTLTCNGEVANFNITYSGSSSNCTTSVYPPGLTLETYTYQSINDGFGFGEDNNTDVVVNISNNRFAAISGFGSSQTNFRRRMDFVSPPTNYNQASQTTVAISECPGDFSNTAICSKVVSAFRSMKFSTNPADNPAIYCILDPTKTYYMNVVNSEDPYNIAPYCTNSAHSTCAIFYTESVQ